MRLRIEPAEGERTCGTRVYLDDVEITGITGLTLEAKVGELWRCTMDMNVIVDGFQVDTTTLANEVRVYRQASRRELLKALMRPMFHG